MTAHEVTPDPQLGSDLVPHMNKDQLRSLFYLFTGKPDSQIKVFSSPVHLKREDIVELNDYVTRKLAIHSIDAVVATVKVGYEGSRFSEFGMWVEFERHHWQEPEKIEEIVLKWDFLVKIDGYQAPQRHTVLFRVAKSIRPAKLIQMVMAGNSDEYDQVDMVAAAAFCRVDFINSQLSKELINVISDWYESRKEPCLIPDLLYWFKKRKQGVAEIFDHWLQFSWALLVCSAGLLINNEFYSGAAPIHIVGGAVFVSVYSLRPLSVVARRMAAKVYKSLSAIEGSRVVFEFTSGDRRRISEQENENRKQGRAFLTASGWNILLNLVAAGIYAYLFTSATH